MDGGSGRWRDLLTRRTVPWLLAALAAYLVSWALLPPPLPVGWVAAFAIGGWAVRREKQVGRARLMSLALSRREPKMLTPAEVGPLSQDAVNRAQGRILAGLILGVAFFAALLAGGWAVYFADGGTRRLVVAVAVTLLFPLALYRPLWDVWETWRRRATLDPNGPRLPVTVVGFLPGGGLVLADRVIAADQVTAALSKGSPGNRLQLAADGAPAALFVSSGVHGANDLVPGDVLVCHGRLAAGHVIALSSATRTYWPGIIRAL
jgi:hypothetical protein